MTNVLVAKVKNVLSGDTVVLVPSKTTQFPVPERQLTLSYIRSDDFQAKEFLRQLLIGKEIKFKVNYKNPATGREFGDIQAPIFTSLIKYVLQNGQAKLKDNFSESEGDIYYELKEAEDSARLNKLGIWGDSYDAISLVDLNENIINKSKKYPIKVIVERVISGDRVVARLLINKNHHVQTPILLAGLKAPRTDDVNQPANVTKVGQQAKAFVEDKFLTTRAELTVQIIGESQTGVPIGIFGHASGNNIHEKLLEAGLGEIVDWQSSLIGSSTMAILRRAEQSAKALGKGLYANVKPVSSSALSSSTKLAPGVTIDNAQVARVISADTLVIRLPQSDEEVTVQLASVRGPRPNDTTAGNSQSQQALVATAKEFVREKVIGKSGKLYVESYRQPNQELKLDGRFLVSFKLANNNDLSELIISNGWGTVIRHNKATSHERSVNWDRLLELEEEAKKAGKKGIYASDTNKVLTVGTRIIDASENFSKAKTFFNGFKQKGRMGGFYVEFVPSGTRVKLFNPKEGLKLTLILGGLSNDKSEINNDAAVKFLNKKYLQKSVEFEVYDTDKIGGFIGNLFTNANTLSPVQVNLLEQGLVKVHPIALHTNPFANELSKAEDEAKNNKKGIWSDYDADKVAAELQANEAKIASMTLEAAKPKFYDIEVVDVDKTGIISFHHLDSATESKFANFKTQFNQFHAQNTSASANSIDLPFNLMKPPKKNEVVSAKLDDNGKYYRAKVVGYDKASNKYQVKHVDFGNYDNVPLSSLRALPAKFNLEKFPPFAHTTTLQNITLPPSKPTDYLTDAIYALEDLVFDKKLVIAAVPGTVAQYEGILYDSEQSLKDPSYTINKQLVSEGWGIVNKSGGSKDVVAELAAAEKEAKAQHLGCWEFGDVSFDDEEL